MGAEAVPWGPLVRDANTPRNARLWVIFDLEVLRSNPRPADLSNYLKGFKKHHIEVFIHVLNPQNWIP